MKEYQVQIKETLAMTSSSQASYRSFPPDGEKLTPSATPPLPKKSATFREPFFEAESAAQAREIVERNWKNSEYVLDADHFQGVTFTLPARQDRER